MRKQVKTPLRTDALTNSTVRAAIDALQAGDADAWAALFDEDAALFDDGEVRSLETFTRDVLGHEHFTSIEHIGHGGLELVGQFHSDQWGDFRTYFRFRLTSIGKISRLDIGQAKD